MRRTSGILLHPTSLPGGVVGTLGEAAHRFADWLALAEQRYWQILPLVPVGDGGSPYNGLSAMAGNPMLISGDGLVDEGLLDRSMFEEEGSPDPRKVDFAAAHTRADRLVAAAYRAYLRKPPPLLAADLERFRDEQSGWLQDYALFRAVRTAHDNRCWTEWAPEIRDRDESALRRYSDQLRESIELHVFAQFLFDRQWSRLREYAAGRGIRIIGDLPIFVAHDSADVWANRELFELDSTGQPTVVAGVPPDYFSETGQRWGNPLYRWDVMEDRGYSWWIERFRRTFEWVDVVRVDHFRGFESYWSIPADEPTAVAGEWESGPGSRLFDAVRDAIGELPIIAEDLGLITDAVHELRDRLGFPGMRVLQFGFYGNRTNPHLPDNYPERSVGYTGTHDNDTLAGWWGSLDDAERARVRAALSDPDDPVAALFGMVWSSQAELVVAPVQDVLQLGTEARMNTPGTTEGNWFWRLERLPSDDAGRWLRELTRSAGRATPVHTAPSTGTGE